MLCQYRNIARPVGNALRNGCGAALFIIFLRSGSVYPFAFFCNTLLTEMKSRVMTTEQGLGALNDTQRAQP